VKQELRKNMGICGEFLIINVHVAEQGICSRIKALTS